MTGIHGSYAANKAVSQCDVLCLFGTRFNDRITGKMEQFASHAKIIHIDIDSASISRNILVDIPIVADAKVAIGEMLKRIRTLKNEEWVEKIIEWKHNYPILMKGKGMTPQSILEQINCAFDKAIFTTDVWQNQLWASHTEEGNHDLAALFKNTFSNRIEIVRGGSVGVEAITRLSKFSHPG